MAMKAAPGKSRSSAYCPAPRTNRASSRRFTESPMPARIIHSSLFRAHPKTFRAEGESPSIFFVARTAVREALGFRGRHEGRRVGQRRRGVGGVQGREAAARAIEEYRNVHAHERRGFRGQGNMREIPAQIEEHGG